MPRLDLLVAKNLRMPRRAATRMVRAGRICELDGTPLRDPKIKIPPADLPRSIMADERTVSLRDRFHVLQHKPRGVVTAMRDERHPTAYALLAEAPLAKELRAVGRLDRDTSGLLFWTTDGALLHRLTHPRYALPRTYQAALDRPYRPLPQELVLDDGHRPRILELRPLPAEEVHPSLALPAHTRMVATVTITSGRFHEVRRLFAALGATVIGLTRVAYGDVLLPQDLQPGDFVAYDLQARFRGLSPAERDI